MTVGRPGYDLVAMAEKLLAWSAKEDSFNLCAFCGDYDVAPSMVLRWVKDNAQFSEAYEKAKARLGARREKGLATGAVHVKAYDLNAKTYDRFLKEEHREHMELEAQLRDQSASVRTPAIAPIPTMEPKP